MSQTLKRIKFILFPILLLLGLASSIYGLQVISLNKKSKTWEKVEANVLKSNWSGYGKDTWSVDFQYSYTLGDQKYVSNRVMYGFSFNKVNVRRFYENYDKGGKLFVRVNKNNPSECTVMFNDDWALYFPLVMGISLLFFSVIGLLTFGKGMEYE